MRAFRLTLLFTLLTSSTFGQQFLWSTVDQDTVAEKFISIEQVTTEVLKFYDHYEMHYDFSGFSKKRFMEDIDYGFEDWKWINEVTDLTVFALRSNMGSGSVVLVMFVSKKI